MAWSGCAAGGAPVCIAARGAQAGSLTRSGPSGGGTGPPRAGGLPQALRPAARPRHGGSGRGPAAGAGSTRRHGGAASRCSSRHRGRAPLASPSHAMGRPTMAGGCGTSPGSWGLSLGARCSRAVVRAGERLTERRSAGVVHRARDGHSRLATPNVTVRFGAQPAGHARRAGRRASVVVGEVIQDEPTLRRRPGRPRLDHRGVPRSTQPG